MMMVTPSGLPNSIPMQHSRIIVDYQVVFALGIFLYLFRDFLPNALTDTPKHSPPLSTSNCNAGASHGTCITKIRCTRKYHKFNPTKRPSLVCASGGSQLSGSDKGPLTRMPLVAKAAVGILLVQLAALSTLSS